MSAVDHVEGKVIVVTGAGGGFGGLVSRKAAARGARIVCADIDEVAVRETAAAIVAEGGEAIAVRADVTSIEDLKALAAAAVERFGRIDVMINNAGVMPLAFFSDHEAALSAWHKCIDINFKGVLNGMVAVYDQMIAQGRGHVINVSSIYGNFPVAGAGVYGATKAAVNVLSETLRVESQGKIKVTTVKPTGVPGTNLGSGIVNGDAMAGILGQNAASFGEKAGVVWGPDDTPEKAALTDPEDIRYWAIAPEELAEQIVYVIDQPWGVSISDITVRASGDPYVI